MKNLASISEHLVRNFEKLLITDAFIVTGGAIAGFTEALAKSQIIKCHYMLNEQSAAIAAEAYGHYDGKPALLVTTSGPGVTNAITGVAAAWTNSSPIIVVSGQARTIDVKESLIRFNRQIGNQHLNTIDLVRPVTKFQCEPTEEFDVSDTAKKLYSTAVDGRKGPVWLSLPSDLQRLKVEQEVHQGNAYLSYRVTEDLENLVRSSLTELFQKSTKPLVLLGNGARANGILPNEISHFLMDQKIPVLTTWPGLDLIADDFPHYFGRPGTIASDYVANLAVQNCDALLILGARLDMAQIGFRPNDFASQAKVLRIDIDESEFLRIPPRNLWQNINADISEISFTFSKIDSRFIDGEKWVNQLNDWGQKTTERNANNYVDGLSTYGVVELLQHTKRTQIVCGSSGTCVEMVLQSWRSKLHQRFTISCGLGSMGFGLAAAIGIYSKTAEPILLLESDGSFSMNIQDLETIAKKNFPISIVVLNSGGYKSIKLSQRRQEQFEHGTNSSSGVYLPDPVAWATAAGIPTVRTNTMEELRSAFKWIENDLSPKLIDVRVSEIEEAVPRLISKVNTYGFMETVPFDQLWP